MDLSIWMPMIGIAGFIVVFIGLNQLMIQRVKNDLQQSIKGVENRQTHQMEQMESRMDRNHQELKRDFWADTSTMNPGCQLRPLAS